MGGKWDATIPGFWRWRLGGKSGLQFLVRMGSRIPPRRGYLIRLVFIIGRSIGALFRTDETDLNLNNVSVGIVEKELLEYAIKMQLVLAESTRQSGFHNDIINV